MAQPELAKINPEIQDKVLKPVEFDEINAGLNEHQLAFFTLRQMGFRFSEFPQEPVAPIAPREVKPARQEGFIKRNLKRALAGSGLAGLLASSGALSFGSAAFADGTPPVAPPAAYAENLHEEPAPGPGSLTDFYVKPGQTRFVNFTVTETLGAGFFGLQNVGDQSGVSSNLNASFVNQTIAGASFVKSNSADGKMQIFTQRGGHELIDDEGAFADGAFNALTPNVRALDTRPNGLLPAGSTTVVSGGQPNSIGVVNITTTDTLTDGYIEDIACDGSEAPGAHSEANATKGYTIAKTAVVQFDSQGKFCLFNQNPTSLVVDVQGYFASNSVEILPTAVRVEDSRLNSTAPLPAGSTTTIHRPEFASTSVFASVLGVGSTSGNFIQVLMPGQAIGTSSVLNTDPKAVMGNLVIINFDENGNAQIYNNGSTHLVVDVQALIKAGKFIPNSSTSIRTRDTRDGTEVMPPIESVPMPSCDKAAWTEGYQDPNTGHMTYKYAVYDNATNTVVRYNAPDIADSTEPIGIQYDPSLCNDPSIMYSVVNPVDGKKNLFERHLSDGVIRYVPVKNDSLHNVDRPDPQIQPGVVYYEYDYADGQDMSLVLFTPSATTMGAGESYSISDSGTIYAQLQQYQAAYPPTNITHNYVDIKVTKFADTTRINNQTFSSEVMVDGANVSFSSVQVNSIGTRAFVLKRTGSGTRQIYEVVQDNNNTTVADFIPISYQNSDVMNIVDYRAIGPNTIIAAVTVPNGSGPLISKMVKIDLTSGVTTDIGVTSGQTPFLVTM